MSLLSQSFRQKSAVALLIFCATLAGAGCAATPPPLDFLDEADQAALKAAEAGALEHAPLELKYAREKLAEARTAAADRDYPLARQLASQSQVNSELAASKTLAAQAREEARAMREANEALERELGPIDGDDS
ncbi:MAG: DUF4398 domain-containing protein [Pseudomonadota bacterium]